MNHGGPLPAQFPGPMGCGLDSVEAAGTQPAILPCNKQSVDLLVALVVRDGVFAQVARSGAAGEQQRGICPAVLAQCATAHVAALAHEHHANSAPRTKTVAIPLEVKVTPPQINLAQRRVLAHQVDLLTVRDDPGPVLGH